MFSKIFSAKFGVIQVLPVRFLSIKVWSALAIVFIGQINYLHQHHDHKLQDFKDAKKIVAQSPIKQLSARMRDIPKIVRKRILLKNYSFLGKIAIKLRNFILKSQNFTFFDFNNFRLIWFGCRILRGNRLIILFAVILVNKDFRVIMLLKRPHIFLSRVTK